MRCFARGLTTALTLAALTGAAPPASAGAQLAREARPTVLSLRPGDTVRVWALRPRFAGTRALIAELGGDTLLRLGDLPGRSALRGRASIALPAVARLEVQRGYYRSAGRTAAGVVLGLVGGALLGSLTGVALECGRSCSDQQNEFAGLAGVVIGGGLGALAGAITGGVLGAQRRPRWEPVALPAR